MKFLIDKDKLQTLLKDFFTITKIRIVVFDDAYQEVAAYPNHHSKYCELLRQDKNALKKCSLCDKEACEKSKRLKQTIIYQCYAGLTEAVSPIQHGDITVGYIMFGQLLKTDDKAQLWEKFYPIVSSFDVDQKRLRYLFFSKDTITGEMISSVAALMQACAGYLYLSKAFSIQKDSIETRIDAYIKENLSQDLSVSKLCDIFALSKNRLYEISEYAYGEGIAEHIRKIRIEQAKLLMKETNKKINEIATICGIPDYNYFTKIFKRMNGGITPREYRKRLNNEAELQ